MQDQTFGSFIKKLREQKGLTLQTVSSKLSVDVSMLARIEKNERKPTKEFINRIASFFNVAEKDLTIAFLSDTIVYKILENENLAMEAIKAAEVKMTYLKQKR